MPYETCSTAPRVIPSKSAGVTKAPASAWAVGTWTEFAADSGAADLLLLQIILRVTTAGYGGSSVWEIGLGAAGAESVVATWRIALATFGYSSAYGNYPLALPVLVPAHSRIAVRARSVTNYGSPATCSVLLGVQDAPDPLEIEVAPGPGKVGSPLTTTVTGTSSASAWTWSAWIELAASVPEAWLSAFSDYFAQADAASVVEVQFGTGAGGAEVAFATVSDAASNLGAKGTWGTMPFAVLHEVQAGTRVAARMRKTRAYAIGWGAEIAYFEVAP